MNDTDRHIAIRRVEMGVDAIDTLSTALESYRELLEENARLARIVERQRRLMKTWAIELEDE